MENEQGKEQLLLAKEAAQRATANIFGGQAVPAYCKRFIDEVWVDYLTLLQLREEGDGESEAWKDACKLGQRILWISTSEEHGLGRAAQIETLAQQIRNQVGALLPHQERKIEEFIEALYTPAEAEEETEAIPPPPTEEAETPVSIDQQTLDLYNKLRTLPNDTWFEFNSGTDQSGVCQDSCHFFHAANALLSGSSCESSSRAGLSQTTSFLDQSRVMPDQRSGCLALACS